MRRTWWLAVLGALLLSTTFVSAPASAADASFELASMPAWVAPGGAVPVGLRLQGSTATAEIEVTVHNAVISRTAYEQTLMGRGMGSVIARANYAVADLVPAEDVVVLPMALADPAGPRDDARLSVRRTGVYPMSIVLVVDGEVASEIITQLVVADSTPERPAVGERLGVGWIWPIVTEPAYLPDTTPNPSVVAEFRAPGRLGRMLTSLSARPTVGLTLAPGPETLEAWGSMLVDDPTLVDGPGVIAAQDIEQRQILTSPYVPLDLPSLLANDLGNRIPTEIAAGADALNATVGRRIDPRTAVLSTVDTASLASMREAGVDRIVVPASQLVPVDTRFTAAEPLAIDADGRRFSAFASDDTLVAILEGTGSPALRAQQFLSWLSVVALEQPNRARAIVASMPTEWNPPAELLNAILTGLDGHPLLEAATLDQLFDRLVTDPGALPARELAPITPGRPPVTAAELNRASDQLGAFTTLVGTDNPAILWGTRAILVSITKLWADDPGRARAELATIEASVADFASNIKLATERTVTITAREATVPVAVLNETGQPVRVRVHLESDKLFFPEGADQIVTLPPRSSTVNFVVEARASGTFPLLVSVTSTDGGLELADSKLAVRSTVVSGVGVFLAVGAGLFLAIWWALHFRKNRRTRHPMVAVAAPDEPVAEVAP